MRTIWIDRHHHLHGEWLALRHAVLRAPLGLSYSRADLEEERNDRHLLLFVEDRLAGGLLVRELDGDSAWKIRQVAVAPEFQGQGLGRELMKAAEAAARAAAVAEIVLHARETVVEFYLRLGYSIDGESFTEVGIPHRRMRRLLG